MEPDLLAVSCERVKTGVLRLLARPDQWRSKVLLRLHPASAARAGLEVASTRYTDHWQYDIEVPEQVDPTQLVRVLVHVILTEIANRTSGSHPPEVPIWLIEGMTAELLGANGPDLVSRPNALIGKAGAAWGQLSPSTRMQWPADNAKALRAQLSLTSPPTFNDLSLPSGTWFSAERVGVYRAGAQLLLEELTRLPEGPSMLNSMLAQLTTTLNWQTAFLRAYATHFQRLLDVEKWWAVTLAQFTGRDESQAWPLEVSLQRLDAVLRVQAEVRTMPHELPQRSNLSLQQVILQWDGQQQARVLVTRLGQLRALQLWAKAEVLPLVRAYYLTLHAYLDQRARFPYPAGLRGQAAVDYRVLLRDTTHRLDELDARRSDVAAALTAASVAPRQP